MAHFRIRRWVAPLAIVVALAATLTGCSRSSQTELPPIVAMVNGEAITLEEFNRMLAAISSGTSAEGEEPESTFFWDEALDQLIEKKVMLQEARSRGINVTDLEVEEAIRQMKGDYSDEAFAKLLQDEGMSLERWKAELTENLLVDKFMATVTEGLTDVTDAQIKAYYEQHRKDYAKKSEVRARQIVVSTEPEANAVREQLLNGVDFASLAREKSISPDGENGGDLGFFSEGEMPEDFAITFKLRLNEISPVVKSPYGYHIFRVEAKRPPRTQTLREVRDSIQQALLSEQEEAVRGRIIEDLKSKAHIQVNSDLLIRQAEAEGTSKKEAIRLP